VSSRTDDTRAAKAARGGRAGAKPAGGAGAKPARGTAGGAGAKPARGAAAGTGAKPARGGSPPPRRRLPAEERRSAILDAALEVFAQHGYHAASIDDIAGVAGVSKALIYEHFPSKRHLHAALLERHVGELFERLVASAATSEPGEVRLRAGVDAFLSFVESRPDAFRMLFRDAVEPEVAEVLRTLGRQAALQVAELIATEPRERRPDDDEEDEAIEMFGALLTGAVQSLAIWWDEHPKVPRERLVDRVMEFAWLGFERLRAGDRLEKEGGTA
jgi:AcrR family transcriptional regulator